MVRGKPKFLGYVPTGFRVYGGSVAQQHSRYLTQIEKEVHSQIVTLLRKIDPELTSGTLSQLKLGEIKDYASLVPASQRRGLPLYSVDAGTPSQRANARSALVSLAKKVELRIREF